MKINKFIIIITFFVGSILLLSLRGLHGNPGSSDLLKNEWRDDGPFELSPERGRFALTYSLVEHKSVYFPVDIARFVIPDLGYKDGNYVSLFAPLMSFLVVPGYVAGKFLGVSQIGTFIMVTFMSVVNFILIISISKRLGSNKAASILAASTFAFATPAFAYSVDLYQHHATTMFLLLSLYLLFNYKNFWGYFGIFSLYGLGIALDYPNAFILLPIIIASIIKMITIRENKKEVSIGINLQKLLSVIGVILPILFFLWFNNQSYGNPLLTLGNSEITSVKDIDESGNPLVKTPVNSLEVKPKRTPAGFFVNRRIINGLYIHLFGNERGILFYSPVIFIGLLGIKVVYRKYKTNAILLITVVSTIILLYSMWGDPWGGWAFGSRYLIPVYSIMAIFLSFSLSELRKHKIFLTFYLLVLIYSIGVSTLGALTTNKIPPKGEAIALEQVTNRKEHYTYMRNWEFIQSGKSKSFIFQNYANKYITAYQYYLIVTTVIIIFVSCQLGYLYKVSRKEK